MKILTALALLLAALAAGCAQGYYSYREPLPPPATYTLGIAGGIPPSFYDNDPRLSYWYDRRYWNPDSD
jgi:hypothetical protein